MRVFPTPRFGAFLLAVSALTLSVGHLVPPAEAASVRQLGVIELVQDSQLIFHGAATGRRVIAGAKKGQIFTRVTFRVDEVIQGPNIASLELDFLGGTLNGLTLSIPDITIPTVGEEGIFFIEQLAHVQVNPIYGWSQGHFIVRDDQAGGKTVATHSMLPVFDVQPWSSTAAMGISGGQALGVITDPADKNRPPMTLDQFKSALRGIAEATR